VSHLASSFRGLRERGTCDLLLMQAKYRQGPNLWSSSGSNRQMPAIGNPVVRHVTPNWLTQLVKTSAQCTILSRYCQCAVIANSSGSPCESLPNSQDLKISKGFQIIC
jgi:hypothetical protein